MAKQVETPKAVTETEEQKTGRAKWSAAGTKDAQAAINGMDAVIKRFTEVCKTANSEEQDAYRAAYVTVCKMAGTQSALARASECNRVFGNMAKDSKATLEILEIGLGYHATIAKLPTLKKSGKPKADPASGTGKGEKDGKTAPQIAPPQKHKSADKALEAVFENLKLVQADNGTCKALLNAVLGIMEQSKAEYLVELAAVLATEWEAFEESHDEAKGTVGVLKAA
ncbi:MAG: hypothetical protein KGI08_04620 [Thaumarchaeota archaeon]|nr:hypothetical protein [Nitrososphaerota archaeon]